MMYASFVYRTLHDPKVTLICVCFCSGDRGWSGLSFMDYETTMTYVARILQISVLGCIHAVASSQRLPVGSQDSDLS